MKTDKNGCSTTLAGEENYESFDYRGRKCVHYEYRSPLTGDLFTCTSISLDLARERRDRFLKEEQRKEAEAERRFNLNHIEYESIYGDVKYFEKEKIVNVEQIVGISKK